MPTPHDDQTSRQYNIDLARKLTHESPELRADRITAAKRALSDDTLMLDAEVLAERLLSDPQHQPDTET